jgi:hypothetical protein
MILIIKDMDLPQSCGTCRFSYFTVGIRKRCEISGDEVNPLIACRETNCPLVKIFAPHGRLIDADELNKKLERHRDMCGDVELQHGIDTAIRILNNTPTIIEAEVSE